MADKIRAKLLLSNESQVSASNPLPTTVEGSVLTNIQSALDAINAKLTVDGNGNLEVTVKDNDDATMDFDDEAPVGGAVAHDSADAGNPTKVGGKAISSLGSQTPVAAADRSNLFTDLQGRLLTVICPQGDLVSGVATISDGSSTQVIAAQSTSVAVIIMKCFVTNTDADTGGYVQLKDGTTVKAEIPCPMAGSSGAAGAIADLSPGILGSAATAWNADPSATIADVRVTLIGYRVKV